MSPKKPSQNFFPKLQMMVSIKKDLHQKLQPIFKNDSSIV